MKNLLNGFTRTKVFVLALAFALPMMAHAEGFKGKFTLTSETHWGSAVLTPGGYDFTLDSASAPSRVVIRGADGHVVAILISMWASEAYRVKDNRLQLETRGSEIYVSAVYLADVDTEMHFAVPPMEGTLARSTAKTQPATMAASVR